VAAHLLHVPLPLAVYRLTTLLPFLTGDDLQNTQNRNKQSILVFFSPSQIWFLWVCFSVFFFFPSFSSGRSIVKEPTLGGGRRCYCDGKETLLHKERDIAARERDNVWLVRHCGQQ
jgi:hypothetical protein